MAFSDSRGLTASERTIRARLAALHQHAQGRTNTGPGTVAFLARFERQVDPDGILPAPERARRAEYAKRAHFTEMAYRSARARRTGSPKTV